MRAPGALPRPTSDLVGRNAEVRDLAKLVRSERFVTLTGPGGVGKTRLALEVAGQLAAEADHAVFVPLAAVQDPALVELEVASALSPLPPGADTIARIAALFGTSRALVVLDNCEHLVDACAHLVSGLVSTCPGVWLLATSRGPLGVGGETRFELQPLEHPGHDEASPSGALSYSAVRLFVEAARRQGRDFRLTAEVAPAVGRICRALDGLPLAIELAAAWTRMLSPAEIETRLGDRLDTLATRDPTAPERHRTVRACIDYGYTLLTPGQQELFASLGVFSGGFSLEAAEAVCNRSPLLEDLERLVDLSLVVAEPGEHSTRYRMLETVRRSAWNAAVAEGEAGALRARHLEFFGEIVSPKADEPFVTVEWLDAVESDHDNIRAALRHSLETDPPDATARLVLGMAHFWTTRGHFEECRSWYANVTGRPQLPSPPLHVRVLAHSGRTAVQQGDYEQAQRLLDEALDRARESSDVAGEARALIHLGHLATRRGEHASARKLLEQALELSDHLGSHREYAEANAMLGTLDEITGDYTAARARYERNLANAQTIDNVYMQTQALAQLAHVAYWQADYPRATRLIRQVLDVGISRGHTGEAYRGRLLLAAIDLQLGRLDEARAEYEGALALARRQRSADATALCLANIGHVDARRGDYASATKHFAEALSTHRRLGRREGIAFCLQGLASAAHEQGDLDEAWKLHSEAVSLLRDMGHRQRLGISLAALGAVAADRGDFASSSDYLEEGLAITSEVGDAYGEAVVRRNRGRLFSKDGSPARARTEYEAALRFFETNGNGPDAALVLSGLGDLETNTGNFDAAMSAYRRALILFRENRFSPGIASSLEGVATVYARAGRLEPAAQVLGAAESLRQAAGIPASVSASHQEQARRLLETGPSSGANELARLAGREMPLGAAIDLALHDAAEGGERIETCEFRRDGSMWTIEHAGRVTHLRDQKGLRYLAMLLGRPGRAMHVVYMAAAADDPSVAEKFEDRLASACDDVEEAEASEDAVRISKARDRLDGLIESLGLTSGERATADKTRSAVTQRIRDAQRRILEAHPDLGRYLEVCISTGTLCAYRPDPRHPIEFRL